MQPKFPINIDYSRDNLFDTYGLSRLRESYMTEDEKSPQERFAYVSAMFASNEEHAQRMYDCSSKHWLSYATPILSFGKSKHSMPVSCFLPYLEDSAKGLVDTLSEVNWLSMGGGGIGLGVGIRSEDEKSAGVMPHMKIYEASAMAYKQGKTRRGSYAAYLDINHPNIVQFIEMRKPTGDSNIRCLELHHAVNITDDFMQIIEKCMIDRNYDDTWELKDPGSDKVKSVVSAKWLWELIMETRMRTGEPYLHFIDTANKHLPEFQKKLGLEIKNSNLCLEISIPHDPIKNDRTPSCFLVSYNVSYWDEWKDIYQFYKDTAEFLDNVIEYFIENGGEYIKKATYAASRERAIGIGALGFHDYLQQKNVPFESAMATSLNRKIFSNMKDQLYGVNRELGTERGECPDAKGYGLRFSQMTAIAPNASSSIVMGNTSPSIEPYRACGYRQDTLGGAYFHRNRNLDMIIKRMCDNDSKLNCEDIWMEITTNAGSIQHMSIFDDYTKDVYKTASEIDQRWIVEHAANRQEFIDQSQSVNLFFKADASIRYIHKIHFDAWKKGLKTLYYCRSDKLYHGDALSKSVERYSFEEVSNTLEDECLACSA